MVGGDKCPIVDTYWQTETGAHVLAPLPGVWPAKPGSATLPFFGVQPAMVNEQVHVSVSYPEIVQLHHEQVYFGCIVCSTTESLSSKHCVAWGSSWAFFVLNRCAAKLCMNKAKAKQMHSSDI